jgi:hypothetical protein
VQAQALKMSIPLAALNDRRFGLPFLIKDVAENAKCPLARV